MSIIQENINEVIKQNILALIILNIIDKYNYILRDIITSNELNSDYWHKWIQKACVTDKFIVMCISISYIDLNIYVPNNIDLTSIIIEYSRADHVRNHELYTIDMVNPTSIDTFQEILINPELISTLCS